MDCRVAAARVVAAVAERGQTLPAALAAVEDKVPERDRGLLRELSFGAVRFHPRLLGLVNALLKQPLKKRDHELQALMIVGAYQLLHTRVPPHAALDSAVRATKGLQRPWARGLVNGVLRQLQRRHGELETRLTPAQLAAHPLWWYQLLAEVWPDELAQLLNANNEQAPLTLRVNRARLSREDYQRQLDEKGLAATACGLSGCGVVLRQAVKVEALPGFNEGLVSVQDEAAQLTAPLLAPEAGERVLDACAAPGGKTCHLLEYQPALTELVAIDNDAERLQRVQANLERLQLTATLHCADVSDVASWWDGRPFDRILLDAPCSGSGVIRRHPDIKLLRRADDIPTLADQQLKLLTSVWTTLAPGGRLLYATCSVLPQENEQVIARFLETTADAAELAITADWGQPRSHGRQLLPAVGGPDGFYYALLEKR